MWEINNVLKEPSLEAKPLIVFTFFMIQKSLKKTDGKSKSVSMLWFQHPLPLAQLLSELLLTFTIILIFIYFDYAMSSLLHAGFL